MNIFARGSTGKSSGSETGHQLRKSKALALSILLIASSATIVLWYSFAEVEEKAQESEMEARLEQTVAAIDHRMLGYEEVLRGGVGLFQASREVSREEWHAYVEILQLNERYPGIQGIGFAKRIAGNGRQALVKKAKSEGFPRFFISPPGEREEYYPIIYLEPVDERNLRAFGFDMFSEAVRRRAMERARDTGAMAVSEKVRLVQETDERPQAGVLMYLPVFRNRPPHSTREERRKNIVGFVYSPFRMNNLMHGILGSRPPDIDLEIYDGEAIAPGFLMYDSAPGHDGHDGLSRVMQVSMGGAVWTVRVTALPKFAKEHGPRYSQIALMAGGAISVLLAWITWLLFSVGARANRIAEEMTDALAKSEQRLSYVMEATEEGVWDWRIETGKVYHSMQWCRMLGLDASFLEHPVEHFESLLHTDDRGEVIRRVKKCLDGAEVYRSEHRIRHGEGRYIWVLDRGKVVERDAAGKPLRMVGSMSDISERKRLEKLLTDEAKRYETLLETAGDGIHILDLKGNLIQSNRAFRELLGYSQEEARKLKMKDWDAQRPEGEINLVLRDLMIHPRMFTTRHRRKDGTLIDVEINARPVDIGLDKFLFCSSRNITERLKAEKALSESEARWRFAIDGSDFGLWDWNAGTNKVFFSPRWKWMLGYAEDEVGSDLSEWDKRVHPDDKARCYADLEKHFRGETFIYENEHRVLCKDGSYKWVLDRGKVIEWQADGKPLRVIGTHMDITERKRILEELREAKEVAEEATKLKDKFVALVSHDLKNPLSSMRGFLQLLMEGDGSLGTNDAQTYIKYALDASSGMLNLINDLLDISRIRSGQLNPNLERVDLRPIVESVIGVYSHFASDKQVSIINEIPQHAQVEADLHLIQEVFKNLLSNAIKFCKVGGRVRFFLTPEGEVAVADTGIGVHPALMKDLFSYEVKTSTPGTEGETGTGFGLPLCRDIMRAHEGELRVESEKGTGSVFFLRFVKPPQIAV